MTADKAQLRFRSDEEEVEEEEEGGVEAGGGSEDRHRTLDDILIRDPSVNTRHLPLKGKNKSKKIHMDQHAFKNIEAKIAKHNAAEAFRHRFAPPTKAKQPFPADDDVQDIDEFLGELKLHDGK